MRSPRNVVFWFVVSIGASPLLLGASCGGSTPAATESVATTSAASRVSGPRIEQLAQVDTKDLTDAEHELWVDLVNDQLSPCGQPISVATCAAAEKTTCGACVTAARYLVRLVMEGYDRATLVEHYRGRFAKDALVQVDTTDAPARGADMAKVTIVEFSDFQCPHCGAAHPDLVRLVRELGSSVRLVYKYFPLNGHQAAMPAARAAEAARLQGKFWQMHDHLFEHQDHLSDDDLRRYAQELGLDGARFEADLASPEVQKRVEASKAEGERLGVAATPTFFVNGRQFRESPRTLAAYVREELEM